MGRHVLKQILFFHLLWFSPQFNIQLNHFSNFEEKSHQMQIGGCTQEPNMIVFPHQADPRNRGKKTSISSPIQFHLTFCSLKELGEKATFKIPLITILTKRDVHSQPAKCMKIILTSVVDDKQGQGKRLDGNVENVGFMFTVPSLMGMFQG